MSNHSSANARDFAIGLVCCLVALVGGYFSIMYLISSNVSALSAILCIACLLLLGFGYGLCSGRIHF
jgi:VIT1/CCC1 family predicted Fe2+/Mn2+ transporter